MAPADAPRRRAHAGGILRAVAAVFAGIGYAYTTHEISEALTITAVALSLLHEAFDRPSR